jgi:hypothetical protein
MPFLQRQQFTAWTARSHGLNESFAKAKRCRVFLVLRSSHSVLLHHPGDPESNLSQSKSRSLGPKEVAAWAEASRNWRKLLGNDIAEFPSWRTASQPKSRYHRCQGGGPTTFCRITLPLVTGQRFLRNPPWNHKFPRESWARPLAGCWSCSPKWAAWRSRCRPGSTVRWLPRRHFGPAATEPWLSRPSAPVLPKGNGNWLWTSRSTLEFDMNVWTQPSSLIQPI